MAQRGAPDGWDSLANPPSVVQVTIESEPRGRLTGAGPPRLRPLLAVSLIGAGLVAALLLAARIGGGPPHSGHRASTEVPSAETTPKRGIAQAAQVTEADRFPLSCTGITLTPREAAGAPRSRSGPCWRYGVFVTAILRRVDGVWHPALEATSRSCPQVALPTEVRAQLAVCQR
jgi:hypothetical protein